jgi:predicted membrane-bound mannosyltransferase
MDSNETDYNCPMNYRHFKYEGWLYALAFLLAISLRLIQLGVMPLTDVEASSALQALHIAQGLKPALNPHPFYILSTSVLFFLYGGGTNFLARFMPAFVGSLLVFAPLCLKRITPRPGLLLAFFIALDPGLTALSRQAASPIFAIVFLIFAWGFFDQNKPHRRLLRCAGSPRRTIHLDGSARTWHRMGHPSGTRINILIAHCFH